MDKSLLAECKYSYLFRNMQLYKQKIAAARKGHELLKRKADALKKKFK